MVAAQYDSVLLSFTKQYLMRLRMWVLKQWKLKTQLKSQLMGMVLWGIKQSRITSSVIPSPHPGPILFEFKHEYEIRGGNKETECELCLIMKEQTFKTLLRVPLCHL